MVSRLKDCQYAIHADEAFLQAAGGEATRAARLLDGTAPDATPLERALVELVRKATLTPSRLEPADLVPVRAVAGDDALDYAVVLAAFHFINRVADLLHVAPDALPESLRRFELVRRLAVRATSFLMRRMDLRVRPYTTSFAGAVAGARVGSAEAFAPIAARPKIVELVELAVAERDRSTLPRATVARI